MRLLAGRCWPVAPPRAGGLHLASGGIESIFEIQAKWFDLMGPLIYLRDQALFTMPLGIKTILDRFGEGGGGEGEWQIIVTATLLLTLPMIVIFGIFQRYFIEGIATQGRKG